MKIRALALGIMVFMAFVFCRLTGLISTRYVELEFYPHTN
jgi:hypothetical protein